MRAVDLRERVARLDAPPGPDVSRGIDADLAAFVLTIGEINPGTVPGVPPALAAEEADGVLAESELLRRLASRAPGVAVGPLERGRQHWIAAGRLAHLPPREDVLSEAHFRRPLSLDVHPRTKPSRAGLYSSTGALGTFGMWWCLLELDGGFGSLFPRPWRIWSFRAAPQARVLEIPTAAAWTELVASAPLEAGGVLYPDWKQVAASWDGVHVTAVAAAATQGLSFRTPTGVTAPAFWDVETTYWLRWVFTDVELAKAAVPRRS